MSELGDTFRAWKEYKTEKKENNLSHSIDLLNRRGISFKEFTPYHYKVVDLYEYWPTTGLFINTKTKEKGRGIRKLIKQIEGKSDERK